MTDGRHKFIDTAGAEVALRREVTFTYVRSSGAGGQNVNKVNSKAVLSWDLGASGLLDPAGKERFTAASPGRVSADGTVTMASDVHRERGRNAATCLRRLAALVAAAARPPKARVRTKIPARAKEARLRDKRRAAVRRSGRRVDEDER